MNTSRKEVVLGVKLEEYYWNGEWVVYKDNILQEGLSFSEVKYAILNKKNTRLDIMYTLDLTPEELNDLLLELQFLDDHAQLTEGGESVLNKLKRLARG